MFRLADETRRAGQSLVDAVRSGAVDLSEAHAAADADPLTGRVFAVKVYEAVPGIGKVKSRRAMAAIGVDDDAALADVSTEHRTAIVARFTELLAETG